MKQLTDRREIAKAINVERKTVVRIDLAEADEYGIKSQKVVIDNGTFRDGTPYMVRAEIRAYADEMKFTFHGFGSCIHSDFGYYDVEEMVEYANAPVIKTDSDVVLVIVDSENKKAYAPVILHTGNRVDAHCSTPLTFVDEDNNALAYMVMAREELVAGYAEIYKRGNK